MEWNKCAHSIKYQLQSIVILRDVYTHTQIDY